MISSSILRDYFLCTVQSHPLWLFTLRGVMQKRNHKERQGGGERKNEGEKAKHQSTNHFESDVCTFVVVSKQG